MKNSKKKVYPIAIIGIIVVIINIAYTTRIMNGWVLEKNALVALNTEDGHGISIKQNAKLVSFETGITYNLEITDFTDPEKGTYSVAVPIKHLKPNTVYSSAFRFYMRTNSPTPVVLKSNSNVSVEQTSFETDINYKPITINNGSKEYVIDFTFETNDQGVGFAIFDFNINDTIDTLNVELNNFVFTNFKEIKSNDTVDPEQESEAIIEIN